VHLHKLLRQLRDLGETNEEEDERVIGRALSEIDFLGKR
jgi:hypothetical protein